MLFTCCLLSICCLVAVCLLSIERRSRCLADTLRIPGRPSELDRRLESPRTDGVCCDLMRWPSCSAALSQLNQCSRSSSDFLGKNRPASRLGGGFTLEIGRNELIFTELYRDLRKQQSTLVLSNGVQLTVLCFGENSVWRRNRCIPPSSPLSTPLFTRELNRRSDQFPR